MAASRISLEKVDIENGPTEKHAVLQEEHASSRTGMSQEDQEFLANFPEDKKKRAIRKVDVRGQPLTASRND